MVCRKMFAVNSEPRKAVLYNSNIVEDCSNFNEIEMFLLKKNVVTLQVFWSILYLSFCYAIIL